MSALYTLFYFLLFYIFENSCNRSFKGIEVFKEEVSGSRLSFPTQVNGKLFSWIQPSWKERVPYKHQNKDGSSPLWEAQNCLGFLLILVRNHTENQLGVKQTVILSQTLQIPKYLHIWIIFTRRSRSAGLMPFILRKMRIKRGFRHRSQQGGDCKLEQ